jgi:hypothetical protein
MSPLTRFMNTASAILNEQDARRLPPEPTRPPIFVRTNYLFVEIDDALALAAAIAAKIKIARIENNVTETVRLNADLGRASRQLAQLSAWVEEQFDKERPDGN